MRAIFTMQNTENKNVTDAQQMHTTYLLHVIVLS